ncbi:MAG TPA: efflux RND transporter periplasmic adaptor subunit [Vicinamibacterales bacterium]|nr:efflux RND transporter periplasmic adaptor subunit [Vicinamibacterales bacterium]
MIGRSALRALCLLLAVSACGRRDASTNAADQPTLVTVQPVTVQTLRDVLALPGTIVPSAAAELVAYAPEAARIVELPKAEGEKFASGDLLVRFEIPSITAEIEARERELNDATARAAAAKAEETRMAAMNSRGVIPRNTYEASKNALFAAESALNQAKTQMESAKLLQERTIVRARFAGIVAKRWHNEGEVVAGGSQDPVLRAVDPTRTHVAVEVTLAQLGRVVPGQAGVVRTGTGPDVPATIAVRPTPVEGGPPKVEIRLAPLTPIALPLDSPVQVEIVLDERPQVLVVPTAALLRTDQAVYVMVAGPDNRAHRKDVQVGLQARGQTQVLSGVNPGDQVIVGGLDAVSDGAAISINK